MPAGRTAAHDPAATGPRDWPELAALRAAHRAARHSALRAINDAARVDTLAHRPIATATEYRALVDRYHDAHEAYRAHRTNRRAPNANANPEALRAEALRTALAARAQLRRARAAAAAQRRPWPVAPCAAPRCSGHATVTDPGHLRTSARHLHPIPRRTAAAA